MFQTKLSRTCQPRTFTKITRRGTTGYGMTCLSISLQPPTNCTSSKGYQVMPLLHLPRSSYGFSVCDIPYDFVDIVNVRGLRRLFFFFNLYGHRTISCSAFCRRSDTKTQGDRTVVKGSPQILSGYRTEPMRCPYGVFRRSETSRKAIVR